MSVDLIDRQALLEQYGGNLFTAQIDYAQGCRDIIEDIKNAPTVDAVEVVRCKDCKYLGDFSHSIIFENGKIDVFHCIEGKWDVKLDDYCSKGVRNE